MANLDNSDNLDEKIITSKFRIEFEDCIVLYQQKKKLSKWNKWSRIFEYIFLSSLLILGWFGNMRVLIIFSLLLLTWRLASFLFIEKWFLKRSYKKQRTGEREWHLETSGKGYRYTSGDEYGFASWSEVRRFVETEGQFILFRNPMIGIPVPKRSFQSDEDCAAFGALARKKTHGNSF